MEIKKIIITKALSESSIKTIADFSTNPYKGCSFGCKYCYSALNKNVKKYGNWGDFVVIKENYLDQLKKEIKEMESRFTLIEYKKYKNQILSKDNLNLFKNLLIYKLKLDKWLLKNINDLKEDKEKRKILNNNSLKVKRIIVGTNTDPYQPVEKELRITSNALKILFENGWDVFLMTKSPLIELDFELFKKFKDKVEICYTINSQKVIDFFEKSYNNFSRIKVFKNFIENGINIYLHIGPFIPYFSSIEEIYYILKQYKFKNKFRINIEIINIKNSNPVFRDYLLKKFPDRFKEIINIFNDPVKYNKFIELLKFKSEILKKLPFVKKVKILERSRDSYYSEDPFLNY